VTAPRVLVVEDNLALAENVTELLEDEGMEVLVATRGEVALGHAREHRIDLAIVDVRLPDVTGIELVAALRPMLPGGEVIFMTGNATLDTAIAAVREGVFAYVQKPFDPFDLLALANRALEQVKLRRDRAHLAHELERSEQLHRGVVEAVETLIVGLDHDGRIQMWNRCAAQTTGWEAVDALGIDAVDSLFDEGDRQAVREWIDLAWSTRPQEIEVQLRTRDGGHRTVRWSQASVISDGQTILLLVGLDVTERLALEQRAADAEAMASLATLTAGLAHEIRNPLNAAILQLELLSRVGNRLEDDRARERIGGSVRLVQAEIRRLSKLLEEFLSLARPRSFDLYPISLAAVIEHVCTMQRPIAEAAGVQLIADGLDAWPAVLGDQSKLTQVFINLVVNAIDAMRGCPHREAYAGVQQIEVGAEPRDGYLVVRVVDNGPGMPDEVRSNAFRPFFSTKEQGTGLGLPIVKRIIDLHRGSIEILPAPEGGTSVEVSLRLAPAAVPAD
jgi:PAS domain S-box-containing protein